MMMTTRLPFPWRWFLALAALLAALLVTINLALRATVPSFLRQHIREELRQDAVFGRALYEELLADPAAHASRIQKLARQLSESSGLRVTIIDPKGNVIGESDKPAEELAALENHLYRPEVQVALTQEHGHAIRHSSTINSDMMYVAVPVRAGERLLGFVRVAKPLHTVAATINHIQGTIALASLVVGLLALPVLFWMSRRVTRPIDEMRAMAVRVANGDLSARAPEKGGPELRELGYALNKMSAQLESRMRELAEEKAELQATLANMIEGVLVVDAGSRVRLVNGTLRRLFKLTDQALGRTVLEVFRSAPLHDLLAQTLSGTPVSVREMTFVGVDDRVFDVAAAFLRAPNGSVNGAVVVLHDISRIKQLENVRKEFVANVSHELRTPLSIIKGYIETLLDEQPPDAATSKQFLETIQRHSRRLEALIGDLLSISELESQQARLNLAPLSVADTVRNVAEELAGRAREKNTTIRVDIQAVSPAVRADAQRLHQILVNLLDNAIKYSPSGSQVTVTAQAGDKEVEICVADNGPGIAPEHLSRIFERFYRADKARSRELGGTGLGLSIVKHIVQAHGGRVWAECPPTGGTVFHFTLPRA
jgi:two-component system phosphate regulon sensor histidine kinase PhoR